jgi:hypothetical protein
MRSDFIEAFEYWNVFAHQVERATQGRSGIVQNDPPPGGHSPEDIADWAARAEALKTKILTNFDRCTDETLHVLRRPEPPPAPFGGFDD